MQEVFAVEVPFTKREPEARHWHEEARAMVYEIVSWFGCRATWSHRGRVITVRADWHDREQVREHLKQYWPNNF